MEGTISNPSTKIFLTFHQDVHKPNEVQLSKGLSIVQSQTKHKYIEQPKHPQSQTLQTSAVYVNKESEKQNDEKIALKWKETMKNFTIHIKEETIKAKATQHQIISIIQSSIGKKQQQICIFPIFKELKDQLQKIFQKMSEEKAKQQTSCLPMLLIIQNKITCLKTIHIEYKLRIKKGQFYQFDQSEYKHIYAVSAFELFKVVHENKLLSEVIIRGVQIVEFQQFIEQIYRVFRSRVVGKKNAWIFSFAPSKSLKVAISAKISFEKERSKIIRIKLDSKIASLAFFLQFLQLSQIKASVYLPQNQFHSYEDQFQQPSRVKQILQDLWACLKRIKRLKLSISSKKYRQIRIGFGQSSYVRSKLFGILASFTEIAELSFQKLQFENVTVNDFLAMEQRLATLFQNNSVTHLTLKRCFHFPVLPKITTLQAIHFQPINFRKRCNVINSLVETNVSLRSIICFSADEQIIIGQKLFNQLQTIIFKKSNYIDVENTAQSSLNLKHLDARFYPHNLPFIFPKLTHVVQLSIYGDQIGHRLLSTIPSPYLEELHIFQNYNFTNFDLQMIYEKWPQIKSLTLKRCDSFTIDLKTICKFKKLNRLNLDRQMVKSKKDLLDLLTQGIQIDSPY